MKNQCQLRAVVISILLPLRAHRGNTMLCCFIALLLSTKTLFELIISTVMHRMIWSKIVVCWETLFEVTDYRANYAHLTLVLDESVTLIVTASHTF